MPHGWWHCVINTSYTIAITQNYVGSHNLPAVIEFLRNRPDDVSGYGSCATGASLYTDFTVAMEKVICLSRVFQSACCSSCVIPSTPYVKGPNPADSSRAATCSRRESGKEEHVLLGSCAQHWKPVSVRFLNALLTIFLSMYNIMDQ